MIDVSEVLALARDLWAGAGEVADRTVAEAERAGKAIERQMRAEARAVSTHGHLTSFPASITHEVQARLRGDVVVEVGPDKGRRQGALGNLVYYGGANNGPLASLDGPAIRESERVARELADIASVALSSTRPR